MTKRRRGVIDELIPIFEGVAYIPDNPNEEASTVVELGKNLDALTEIVQSELNMIITTVARDRSNVEPAAPPTLHRHHHAGKLVPHICNRI